MSDSHRASHRDHLDSIESAIAATQLTGISCWATLGTERFARVALPPGTAQAPLAPGGAGTGQYL